MATRRRPAPSRRRRPPRRNRRTPLLVVGGLVLVALLLVGGVLAYEASTAQKALDRATGQAKSLQSQITSGDTDGAAAAMRGLQTSTTTAREHTDGPLWAAASMLPFVGSSVEAVQTASRSLDDIAQRAVPPIVETSTSLDADLFRPEDGRFDLAEFSRLAGPVSTASTVLTENRARIDAIDQDSLIGPVEGPVAELKEKVSTAQSAAAAAARGLRLAPGMLGLEGERTYLVLFQNNAELRATGGIPGATAIIRAENGRLAIDTQASYQDIGSFGEPVLELTEDEIKTYGTSLGTDLRDINLTPDFPRTAELGRRMVERRLDLDIDGVLSVDPVALSYALRGTGPVKAGDDTTLTADNAVDILLNEVYARYADPQVQDAFFADAARRIFTSVLSGRGNSRKTLEGLAQAADERRIMLWSAAKDEQAELADTRLAGALPGPSSTPRVGVYLSDATSSKMQYYLEHETTVEATACTDDGVQTLESVTTITSTAPADASQLPDYITGDGSRSPEGSQQLNVRIFAPWNATIDRLEVDGEQTIAARGRSGERPVVIRSVELAPGQSVRLAVTMDTGPGQTRGPVVTTTPGVRTLDQDQRFPSACGS